MPLIDFAAIGLFAPAPKFTENDVPDLTGKVAIVTGANTGLGKENARALLQHGARVYAACRDQTRANKAIEEIKQVTGKDDIHFLQLDLGNIAATVASAKGFMEKEQRLDILINSAGVMLPKRNSTTHDGYELQFGVNVVGHYAFTKTLEPVLQSTGRQHGQARVVFVSSNAHYLMIKGAIDYDSLRNPSKVSNETHYGQSKLGDVHLANHFAQQWKQDNVWVFSLHPGIVATDLTRASGFRYIKFLFAKPNMGALTQLYCATSPDLTAANSGDYFVPWARKHHASHPLANDPKAIEATVEYCRKAVQENTKANA